MNLEIYAEWRSQPSTNASSTSKKETPKTPPKTVPAQSKLGGGKFNPNINMPTGGSKKEDD